MFLTFTLYFKRSPCKECYYIKDNPYLHLETTAMKLIELNLHRIIDLCRKHKVKSLAVFGSILTDRFNDQSDVDLLVDFEPTDPEKFDYVTNFFDLQDSLESLLKRKVDLVVGSGLRNKYFINNINRTKQVIYNPNCM